MGMYGTNTGHQWECLDQIWDISGNTDESMISVMLNISRNVLNKCGITVTMYDIILGFKWKSMEQIRGIHETEHEWKCMEQITDISGNVWNKSGISGERH